LVDAAENYHKVLSENQKLFNEVQELKGTFASSLFFFGWGRGGSVKIQLIAIGAIIIL
jgi:hypothetical protein